MKSRRRRIHELVMRSGNKGEATPALTNRGSVSYIIHHSAACLMCGLARGARARRDSCLSVSLKLTPSRGYERFTAASSSELAAPHPLLSTTALRFHRYPPANQRAERRGGRRFKREQARCLLVGGFLPVSSAWKRSFSGTMKKPSHQPSATSPGELRGRQQARSAAGGQLLRIFSASLGFPLPP